MKKLYLSKRFLKMAGGRHASSTYIPPGSALGRYRPFGSKKYALEGNMFSGGDGVFPKVRRSAVFRRGLIGLQLQADRKCQKYRPTARNIEINKKHYSVIIFCGNAVTTRQYICRQERRKGGAWRS